MFNVPPANVVKMPLIVRSFSAVLVPLVLASVRLVYVPAITVCTPVVASYETVPPQVFAVGMGVPLVFCVLMVPLLDTPDKEPSN